MGPASESRDEQPRRRAIGSLYRDLLESLKAVGLLESVRAAAGPATARLIDDPPWALGWIEATEWDETLVTLRRLHGKEACIAAGLAVARRQGGGLLKPLVRTVVTLAGSSPAAIYANLDGLYNVTARGVSFEWKAGGDGAGTMLLRAGPPAAPEAVVDFIEGTLHFGTEVCNLVGTFERVPAPAGFGCAWSIRWRPRPA